MYKLHSIKQENRKKKGKLKTAVPGLPAYILLNAKGIPIIDVAMLANRVIIMTLYMPNLTFERNLNKLKITRASTGIILKIIATLPVIFRICGAAILARTIIGD